MPTEVVFAVQKITLRDEMIVAVEDHPIKGRVLVHLLQLACFGRVYEGVNATYLIHLLAKIRIWRIEIGGAEHLKVHHIAASTVPPHLLEIQLKHYRAMQNSIGARFA